MRLHEKIRTLRIEHKLSQGELAKTVGIHNAHLSKLEKGLYNPSLEVIIKLAEAFDVTIDYLVGDSNTLTQVSNNSILKRFEEIEQMPENDKERVLYTIDALIRDVRTRSTCAP